MNEKAFYEGVGDVIEKQAVIPQLLTAANGLLRKNVLEPAVRGVSDKYYDGLAKLDPASGGIVGDQGNAARKIFGMGPAAHTPYPTLGQNTMYGLGQSSMGKFFADRLHGGQEEIGKAISGKSHGVFSMNNEGKINTNYEELPGAAWDKVKPMIAAHPGLAMGGAALLGAGAAGVFGGGQHQPVMPPVQPPNIAKPAPYAGREGNLFTQYQEA